MGSPRVTSAVATQGGELPETLTSPRLREKQRSKFRTAAERGWGLGECRCWRGRRARGSGSARDAAGQRHGSNAGSKLLQCSQQGLPPSGANSGFPFPKLCSGLRKLVRSREQRGAREMGCQGDCHLPGGRAAVLVGSTWPHSWWWEPPVTHQALAATPAALLGPALCAAAAERGIPLANLALAPGFALPPPLVRITRGILMTADQELCLH